MGSPQQSTPSQWSSKWAFIFATTGAAVGLGNIWKFPYIAGVNGGGAFVLVYLLCVVCLGIPLMIAEFMLGRYGRQNPINTMRLAATRSGYSSHWKMLGGLCVLAGFLILCYYSVIAGLALNYVFEAILGHFYQASPQQIDNLFARLISNPYNLLLWHSLIIIGTVAIVLLGVRKGLERCVRYLFPAMISILAALVIYAMTTGFFIDGFMFLFKPDFQALTTHSVLVALGQAFFTLSIAFGTIMMYGAYVPRHISIPKTTCIVATADTLIALLAGLAIFPIVFAYQLEPDAGVGLIFQTLPIAFGHIAYGTVFAVLFFTMLVLTAFTTTISLLEPSVAYLIEKFTMSRARAAPIVGFAAWLIGFGTIFSFNIWSEHTLFGLNFFEMLDYVTSNIMLPIGGLLIAVFVAWFMKKEIILQELDIQGKQLFHAWRFSLGFIAPIAIIFIFLDVTGLLK